MTIKPMFDKDSVGGIAIIPALLVGRWLGSYWAYVLFLKFRIGLKVSWNER